MVHKIIIGRSERDKEKFGDEGVVLIGKQYIQMGKTISLSNEIWLDVVRPHVIMIAGKRGGGKSYTMGVIAEGIAQMPDEVKENISALIIDTMGIYWTMKHPNFRDELLLEKWGMKPKGFSNVRVFVPHGKVDYYKKKGISLDYPFSIPTSLVNGSEWNMLFGVEPVSPMGIAIDRTITKLRESKESYDLDDIINHINKDEKIEPSIKLALESRFEAVKSWGVFDKKGTDIKKLLKPGTVSVVDVSTYSHLVGGFSVRALVIGLLSKMILEERMVARKIEEMQEIRGSNKEKDIPIVWVFIDEAHEFLPKEGKTLATGPLIQVIREGRQPGISLVLATQQPGKLHTDVLTQSDLVISHRVTAKIDINALNSIMQTYLVYDIQKYLDMLPRMPGSAIVLDDNQERIFPIQIRPRYTWHGGETPTAMPPKKKLPFE
ncbi:ATP-binding protein [Nanoarchaeota archaeon]|nr:MAG: ATP-binding protein [Nanoarchaeota archaeon]